MTKKKPPMRKADTARRLQAAELPIVQIDPQVMAGVVRQKVEDLNDTFEMAHHMGIEFEVSFAPGKVQIVPTAFGPKAMEIPAPYPIMMVKMTRTEKL